jgi:fatty acid synthase subunit alpha
MGRHLERFFRLKMPAGFAQADAEEHMRARWGLGPGRKLAVLCLAVAMQPSTRLADADQAREFLASAVKRYAERVGVALPERSAVAAVGVSGGSGLPMVDTGILDAWKKEQNDYLKRQFRVMGNHLNVSDGTGNNTTFHGEELEELRQTMSGLQAELGDEFLRGIRGVFNVKKQRRYSSWWNWAMEDVIRLLHSPEYGEVDVDSLTSVVSRDRLDTIMNRWSPSVETILERCAAVGIERANKSIAAALLGLRRRQIEKGEDMALPVYRYTLPAMAPRSSVDDEGELIYTQVPRATSTDYLDVVTAHQPPHVHLRSRSGGAWQYDASNSHIYLGALSKGTHSGLTFHGKTVLVTGAGPGSIGSQLVRGFIAGGARVIVTTNRTPSDAAPFFAQMYKESGAPGSELTLLPFNAGSAEDCRDLIAHIYDKGKGLDADLDIVVPFAAVPEGGRELDKIDARSELAHRAMLVNLLRMLGYIKQAKERGGVLATVIVPLSPNHGDFGGDGLYSESKLGLETLFNRFSSESWSDYLSVIGAVIGWTRGTGLMNANDVVAEGIEKLGLLTFTAQEMALNILALASPKVIGLASMEPVYADLSGGLLGFEHLKERTSGVRAELAMKQSVNQAITEERLKKAELLSPSTGGSVKPSSQPDWRRPRSNIRQGIPALMPHVEMTRGLPNLTSLVNLDRTVVVVGFSELGPWGSSRTRWQMETQGKLDMNGFTELAWIMGLIKHGDGIVIEGQPYFGWIDTTTRQAVHDTDIAFRYGESIMSRAGIRTLAPEKGEGRGYDPARKEFLEEIVLDEDLPPFQASESVAKSFQIHHGEKVKISPVSSGPGASWTVTFKPGATFRIPKSVPFHQSVAGQVPRGWNPATYGISEDISAQVDPITLYSLCCVAEATYSAGLEDASELYQHIHVSELGNYIGSGAGGLKALQSMYRDRYKEKPVQGDILQETFLNSTAAWVNMLLLGSAGPIKTPVGACATSVESLDTACESIRAGRVKAAFVGGVDDFGEEASYEFDSMKATANAAKEKEGGMLPSEMSRPLSTSRAGFVEAAGCGVQLVMSAELALRMGLPIRAIVAYTQMSADGIGRSLPAPGIGPLTAARESKAAAESSLFDLKYRSAKVRSAAAQIKSGIMGSDVSNSVVEAAASRRMLEDAKWMWNGDVRSLDPSVSPMRAALSAWGLTIDDIRVASFHGTSTKAGDANEAQLVNDQMRHLKRTVGNPLLIVCQKYLTGHPKGAAAAWQINGCMQIMESGIVPGNRNADDVDSRLQELEHIMVPSASMNCRGLIKACMLTSFGFGQKGGIVIVVSPRLLFASLKAEQYESYRQRVGRRGPRTDRAYQVAMMNHSVFKAKTQSAWVDGGLNDRSVFLNPGPLLV